MTVQVMEGRLYDAVPDLEKSTTFSTGRSSTIHIMADKSLNDWNAYKMESQL